MEKGVIEVGFDLTRIGQGEYGIYHCEEDTFVIDF
jgi:hypothetical protein